MKKLLIAALILSPFAAAQASSVSLQPLMPAVDIGSQIAINIEIDFTGNPTNGGGIDIFWDSSALEFADFTFSMATVFGDPSFQLTGNLADGALIDIFNGDIATPETTGIYGTIIFTALQSGITNVGISTASDPLFAWGNFDELQFPDFIGTAIQVSAVPLPAGLWLLLSGMLAGVGFKRINSTRAH